ncbi:related to Cytochrome c oxidase assembly protein 3, mitochondrial [Hanseniaspora guilliermondii]|uniref:Related to Cytochrome c oxidase assembly protein 3, mitochondrial n=1 Tax=Hanseniaspora guilliermondii TaxID=56406 RepID=A0A1L0FP54_9ASCO|nr:related to Cytochrome c oxidase assembly protein 3, mitochondrial [Hanseniaspora guilliermondii]
MATLPHQRKGYYDRSRGRMSNALLRAREPYLKNSLIVGGLLFGLFFGTLGYTYTKILASDDFQDVPIPPISEDELKLLKAEYEASKKKNAETTLQPYGK